MTVAANLQALQSSIRDACLEAGRAASSVRLVAAAKGQPLDRILEAAHAGQRIFGENYAQEIRKHRTETAASQLNLEWHFIGRVQASNAKDIASASLVHGVGSLEQAKALAKRGPVHVLLQLSLWSEASKNGFEEAGIERYLQDLREIQNLHVKGFMAMPPPNAEPRAAFAQVRQLRDRIAPDLHELSMGMSSDFQEAILEGATLVRIGTALFGARA